MSYVNSEVFIKKENLSSDNKEPTLFAKENNYCEDDSETTFLPKNIEPNVDIISQQSFQIETNELIIKEENLSSDEEFFTEDKTEDDSNYFERPHSSLSKDIAKKCDDISDQSTILTTSQFCIKEESFSYDEDFTLNEGDANDDNPESFDKVHSLLSTTLEYEHQNIKPEFTHNVFVKEEVHYNDDFNSESEKTIGPPGHIPLEGDTFGAHFLSSYSEPLYQYSNGRSAENERSSVNGFLLVEDTYQEAQSSQLEWFHHANSVHQDQHLNTMHNTDDSKETLVESTEMGNVMNCKLCQFSTRNKTKLRLHLWDAHKKVIPAPLCCQYCTYQCSTKNTLQLHVFRKHNFGQQPIDCPYCKFRSLSILEIQSHIQVKHKREKKYFHCPQCEYKNTCSSNLKYHITSKHTMEKHFSCLYCNYKCIMPHEIRRHILKIHNKKIRDVSAMQLHICKSAMNQNKIEV